ncbi:DUF58 domain-containing protein [Pararhodobacter sp. CCB-MM2]|uniref:DUF58 domain-containing protein n=1 Tax=Pararhodobacter sp. CCB-MM2 TaxID=1786003 RepID=UPI00082FB9F1|nr:DUF58 domain-containing protein [Pararhodobacter sp. CCB-MM2]
MSSAAPRGADLRRAGEALSGGLPPLLVAAEHLAQSVLPGAHGRRRSGPGAEFWQFRPLMPGDGITRIDWRRSGRGDDVYLRESEWQAARAVSLWVDSGAAMGFSGDAGRETKSDRARLLAMALGLVLLRGGERVGLAEADMPPRAGRAQANALATALAEEPRAEGEHGAIDLHAAPSGGHVVIFSDFLGDLGSIEAALALAAARTMRGILVQVLDPSEEAFPFDGRTRFESMSGHLSFETLRAGDLRAEYRQRLAERKDRLHALARQSGWHATTLHTDRPAAEGLLWLYQALGGSR